MPDTAFAQLYSAIPPELRAILVQQLLNSGVAAASWGWRRWWYALRRINRHDVLYRQYLEQFILHFSTITAPPHLVPFAGSLDADKFLLWPELDEEVRSRIVERPEPGREPSLPIKLKATELLTHPLSNNRLFVVEGEAGVGKTTMARALAYLAAKQALELMGRKDKDGSQIQFLPLYFNAKDLIKLAEDTPVGQINPSGESALKDLLNAVLQKSNRALLVIVDGLDEVGESVQTKALQRLRSLWTEEGNHRYLVLGRPGSVRGVPWIQGDKGALKLTLRPWDEAEVKEFLERWLGDEEAPLLNEDEVAGLVGYIRDHVGLPTPALMVQMVVARYLELRESVPDDVLAQMPETRSKLYQNYLRQLLQRSEDAKPGPAQGGTAQTADQQKRLWLGCLELLLKQDPGLRQRVRNTCSVSDLPDVGRASISGHPCGALVGDSAETEKWWEERKLCRLGHESLHEFLAAEALARLYRGDPKGFWKGWLYPNVFDPYWQQTLIFAMALMSEDDQTALMSGLLKLGSCDPVSELTKRHLEVMAKAWGAGVRYDQTIWEEWLHNEPHPDLLIAVAANADQRTAAMRTLVQQALEGKDEKTKLLAANALANLNPELAVSTYLQLAQRGEDEDVRLLAAKMLLLWKQSLAIQVLKELAQSAKDKVIQLSSALLISDYHSEVSLQTFMRLAQEAEYEWLRNWATKAAADLIVGKSPQIFGHKVEATKNKGAVRAWARQLWAKLEPKPAVFTLEQLALSSTDEWLQLFSAVVLAEHGLDTGISTLSRLARKAKNNDLQLMATIALIELGPKLAISTFEQLAMSSAEERVRFEAAQALIDLNPRVAIIALEELAREAEGELVRSSAVMVLREIGPEAIPTLGELAREAEDEGVRSTAAEALGGLGAPPLGCESLD